VEASLISIKARERATRLALSVSFGLTVLKFGAAKLSDSVGVMSEGVHSSLDVISAAMAFYTVRHAVKPADEDHPFGHGKFETISALFESLLLILAAVLIIYEGVHRLLHPEPLVNPWISVAVMAISLLASYGVYRNNHRVAASEHSMALEANALHFLTDIVTSLAVLVGLLVIHWTGIIWIDPVLALMVGMYIVKMTIAQVRTALLELTDVHLPEEELQKIRDLIGLSRTQFVDMHDLRTRRSGAERHIDFHMNVCGSTSVEESHRVCDEIEARIQAEFPGTSVTIHVEPCSPDDHHCKAKCFSGEDEK